MRFALYLILVTLLAYSCAGPTEESTLVAESNDYFNYSESDQFTGGVQMIPISTPSGDFRVWTKRVGNNPSIKVLLLHGGPGATHEAFECYDGYMPKEGIEYIYYDQLGSYYSDQPEDQSLWTTERFVEEVEQVRKALGLNKDNFFLLGQSWGGILAMEYALKYQENLKGLIISNMMSSVPEYNAYAKEVLGPAMPDGIFEEVQALEEAKDYSNPRYMELLMEHHYLEHLLRLPVAEWPESVNLAFKHINPDVYVYMQGPSEFGIVEEATLSEWDRSADLNKISVPTLVIGAEYDTMDPKHMEWMSKEVPNGRYLYAPNGSHLVQYDDQKVYFKGLTEFLRDVDSGRF